MPDRPTIHLPSSLSKISIYQNMTEELQQRGKSVVISQSQFFDVWKTPFGHVTIPKVHCRLPPSTSTHYEWKLIAVIVSNIKMI